MMKRYCIFLCLVVIFVSLYACGPQPESPVPGPATMHAKGKRLFATKCASCHMIHKELTGPALFGAEERWADTTLLYAFIRNSDSVIQVNDYARKLWLQYNQTAMTGHPDLNDNDIREILDYIQSVPALP